LENIYDKYSAMLYSIAVEISPSQKAAKEILITTFKKIREQNLIQIYPSLCVTLIKLLIKTSHQQLKPKELKHNFKLKQFENTPLLHKFLCEKIDLEVHCTENKLTRSEVGEILREEFNLLRKTKKEELKPSEIFQKTSIKQEVSLR